MLISKWLFYLGNPQSPTPWPPQHLRTAATAIYFRTTEQRPPQHIRTTESTTHNIIRTTTTTT